MSFRGRLISLSAAAVAVAVVTASVLVFVFVRTELRNRIDDSLREGANAIADLSRPAGQLPRPGLGVLPPGAPSLRFVRAYVELVTPAGVFPSGREPLIPLPAGARDVAAGRAGPFLVDEEVAGEPVRVYTQRVAPGFAIVIARSLSEVNTTLVRVRWILLGVGLGGIALAAALGLLVARSALRPVRRLTGTVEEVTETRDLSQRINLRGSDELARLAAGFNTMLAALETSLGAQRQLVADASHELRTPLTSLRTNMEVLARAGEMPGEERARLIGDVIAQLEELSVLVEDVVELARGTEPEQELEDLRLDLLVALAVTRAQTHSPELRFETALEPTVVRGVPARLDRAIRNLLDNAAKWSPPDGRVEVTVRQGEVVVRDHGPGIADEDLPHIFDRFYRSPSARGLPGSGLGLAIVRQVAEAHGGSATARRPDDGGAELRIALPASS